MRFTILLCFLLACTAGICQHDSPDSLSAKVKEQVDQFEQWQDSFNKRQDSIHRARVFEFDQKQNQKNLEQFLTDQKERESKQKKQAIIRIAIGIGLLGLLIFGLLRKRSQGR